MAVKDKLYNKLCSIGKDIDEIKKKLTTNESTDVKDISNNIDINSLVTAVKHLPSDIVKANNKQFEIINSLIKPLEGLGENQANNFSKLEGRVNHLSSWKDIEKNTNLICKNIQNEKSELTKLVNNQTDELTKHIHEQAVDVRENLENVVSQTGKIKTINENVEMALGQQNQMSTSLEAMQKVLTDKQVMISRDIPATTYDEKTIKELGEYGQLIFDQLLTAARWYARKKDDLDRIDAERQEFSKKLEAVRKEAYDQGEQQGEKTAKEELVKSLLNKYEDKRNLLEPKDSSLAPVAAVLLGQGIEAFAEVGQIFTVDENNRQQYEDKYDGIQLGKVQVVQCGYQWNDEILVRAVCEPVTVETTDSAVDTEQATATPSADQQTGKDEE